MRTVVGLYDRFEDAQAVVRALQSEGFRRDDISLVARDATGEYSQHFEKHDVTVDEDGGASGAAAGAGVGAVLGGLGGLLVGLGALAIPGVGPVLAAGPIMSALAGAGIGAVAGGLLGALVDLGIPEEHAQLYAEGVRRGGTLVVVRAEDSHVEHARDILNRFNPIDIEERSQGWRQNNWSRFDPDAQPLTHDQMEFNRTGQYNETAVPVTGQVMDRDMDMTMDRDSTTDHNTIPVVEEELRVGKREVERGGVRVETNVEETPVHEQVHLREERVNVDRRPVDREATDHDLNKAFQEGSMELTETSEEAIVDKRARVVEEVRINKDVDTRVEDIHDTVRRTDVDVTPMNTTGGMNTMGSDWSQYDSTFRSHYSTNYGSKGRDYNYYQPAYQYGYQLANDQRYRGYDWTRLESEARRDWEMNHRDTLWDDIKDAVRHAWQSIRR